MSIEIFMCGNELPLTSRFGPRTNKYNRTFRAYRLSVGKSWKDGIPYLRKKMNHHFSAQFVASSFLSNLYDLKNRSKTCLSYLFYNSLPMYL